MGWAASLDRSNFKPLCDLTFNMATVRGGQAIDRAHRLEVGIRDTPTSLATNHRSARYRWRLMCKQGESHGGIAGRRSVGAWSVVLAPLPESGVGELAQKSIKERFKFSRIIDIFRLVRLTKAMPAFSKRWSLDLSAA
jgi:hypothetical protein